MSRRPLPASQLFKGATIGGGVLLTVGLILADGMTLALFFSWTWEDIFPRLTERLNGIMTVGDWLINAGITLGIVGAVLWGLSVYFKVT